MIKSIHLVTVAGSILFFILRYVWMLFESPMLQKKWVKIFPHIVDTLLLISAIILAVQISQYPLVDGWLTAKVFALLLYIVLGSIALKRGKTKGIRIVAGVLAISTFAYMISVAVSKSILGFFAFL